MHWDSSGRLLRPPALSLYAIIDDGEGIDVLEVADGEQPSQRRTRLDGAALERTNLARGSDGYDGGLGADLHRAARGRSVGAAIPRGVRRDRIRVA